MSNMSKKYLQPSLIGDAQIVDVSPRAKATAEEVNEYYKTHTLRETAKHFCSRRERLPIDPKLKKGRRGAGKIPSPETEVKVVFLKSFTKLSNRGIGRICGIEGHTVAAVERRNKPLKNLFEEYKMQIGNMHGEYLVQHLSDVQSAMDTILLHTYEKARGASLKDLVHAWAELHASILDCTPREAVCESGDAAVKAQLMTTWAEAVKAKQMEKKTAESIYYQPEEESILSDEQKDEEED